MKLIGHNARTFSLNKRAVMGGPYERNSMRSIVIATLRSGEAWHEGE